MGPVTTSTPDLWHHYGRTRATLDRTVPSTFRWSWSQNTGPGPEILGDLTGRRVGDLGAGAARHAAHLTVHHQPARVTAIDASPAQHAMATDLYAHLAPRLRIVQADAVPHLRAKTGAYDVLYSVFGALDFTDPRTVLPAAAAALKPGGRLVFATLAHHLNGAPAQPDAVATDIPAKSPEGEPTTMHRWVLQEHVWVKLLDEAGFTTITVDVLPAATGGPRTADTQLVSGYHPLWSGVRHGAEIPDPPTQGRRAIQPESNPRKPVEPWTPTPTGGLPRRPEPWPLGDRKQSHT
ncbi:class I SAM-dependent methyltransferase [Streptomyces sp. PLAI1-29]|uniref:Class I SAM-dependent methyltransferase n=1 Tax=Streptomyces zingiberis TaxID=2053010 RepID=A0ABX1BTC7_9ACTN|nr:class I SAM-dependent methyltransferase [Streptomyces zingiberis]